MISYINVRSTHVTMGSVYIALVEKIIERQIGRRHLVEDHNG